MHGYVI